MKPSKGQYNSVKPSQIQLKESIWTRRSAIERRGHLQILQVG